MWRFSERHSQEWEKVTTGNVSSIAIKNGKVYAVGSDDNAVYVSPIDFKSKWKKLDEGKT